MDQGTLVKERIEAGNRFLRELEKSIPIVVAFWIKEGEDAEWRLYVSSEQFAKGRLGEVYELAFRILRGMREPALDPFHVRLVGLDDPLVRMALDAYKSRPPKIPFRGGGLEWGGEIQGAYFIKGPTGDHTMASGRETLDRIIDREADFYETFGKPPRVMKLPVLMAYDLAKCGRDMLGEMSGKVFKEGITAFEKEGLHGMSVQIIRDRNAELEFE